MQVPKAVFHEGGKTYVVDARYFLQDTEEGDRVEVIYETDHPEKAVVYRFWGYWLTWRELLGTTLVYIALFQVAVALTKNPTPEALMEQLEYKPGKKKKYKE